MMMLLMLMLMLMMKNDAKPQTSFYIHASDLNINIVSLFCSFQYFHRSEETLENNWINSFPITFPNVLQVHRRS